MANDDLRELSSKDLLQHFIKLVEWHAHNSYSRHTSPQLNENRSAFWAVEKELLRRLGEQKA